jgi:prevent-host-death family protein
MLTINVSQAKKMFLELVRRVEQKESVIIEKKGIPVATLLPYNEYINLNRIKSYLAMLELSRTLEGSGVTAQEIYQESRQELESRDK